MSFRVKGPSAASGDRKYEPWKGIPAGSYHMEITGAKGVIVPDFTTKEPTDKVEIRLTVIEGDRENVPPKHVNQDELEERNDYGALVFWRVSPSLSTFKDGSNLLKLVDAALYKGKGVPEDKIAYWTDPEISDADAEARFNELLKELVGSQVSATVSFKAGKEGKGDNNKVTSVAPVRKKLPAFQPARPALTDEQIKDADPKIVYQDTGEIVYGFYVSGKDGTKFVTQAEWARKSAEKYGGLFSPKRVAEIKAERAAKDAKSTPAEKAASLDADLPF